MIFTRRVLSLRLWRAIFHNSLYDFPLLTHNPEGSQPLLALPPRRRNLVLGGGGITLLILLLQPGMLSVVLAALFILLVAFAGTVSGWLAAARIARVIFREQDKGRYDLLALTPPGVLGVHWAIVTRSLRDDPVLRWLRWLPSGFYLMVGFLVAGVLFGLMASAILWIWGEMSRPGLVAVLNAALALTALIALYSDYIQSVVMGVVTGILLPTFARRQSENAAFVLAAAGYFGFQLVYYALLIPVGLWLIRYLIIPGVLRDDPLPALLLTLLVTTLSFALRELVLRRLWRMAENRLYFDAAESGVRA